MMSTTKKTVSDSSASDAKWTFLTNHSHVLVCLSEEPQPVLRDVAIRVGITERAVQRIVADLESSGLLTRERDGRRNTYRLETGAPLRHELECHITIGEILDIINRRKKTQIS